MLGELTCLNCARHLADLVTDHTGRPRLDHPAGQQGRPILVTLTRTGPRCNHCGGRALLERPLTADIRPQPTQPMQTHGLTHQAA
jgi:hypothetical protein